MFMLSMTMDPEDDDTIRPEYSDDTPCYHAKSRPHYRANNRKPTLFESTEHGLTFRHKLELER